MIYLFVIIALSFFCNIIFSFIRICISTSHIHWRMVDVYLKTQNFISNDCFAFRNNIQTFLFVLFFFFQLCVFVASSSSSLSSISCLLSVAYISFESNALNALGLCIRPTNKRCDINWQNTSFNDKSLELLIKMSRRLIVYTQKLFSMLLC